MRHAVCRLSGYSALLAILANTVWWSGAGPAGDQAGMQTVRAGEVLRMDGGGRLDRSTSSSQQMAASAATLTASFAKVEWHPGELYPRVGFVVTNLARPA